MKKDENTKKNIDIYEHGVKVNGQDFKLSSKRMRMLIYLIKNPGNHTYESVVRHIDSITANPQVIVKQLTKDINDALFDGHPYIANRQEGTVSFVDINMQHINVVVHINMDEGLPKVLTHKSPIHTSAKNVLHRYKYIEQLASMLSEGKQVVALTGFGGVGKTTLARTLYALMDKIYDSYGWIEYNGNGKTSLLASLVLYKEITDLDVRWEKIMSALRNNEKPCILFIDNVIKNSIYNQDPIEDNVLQELSGISNLSLVVTTRLDELKGYDMMEVDFLNPAEAIDLFYFYYDKREYNKEHFYRNNRQLVKKIVDLTGYHTFAVELMAKAARYTPLDEFYNKLLDEGFSFPKLKICTDYTEENDLASKQLKILFDINTRSSQEQEILWDFAIMPNISLSMQEINEWLGYDENQVDSLVKEGWLQYNDGFWMHDLIKSTILLDLRDGFAPKNTLDNVMNKVLEKKFISRYEDFCVSKKKFDVLVAIEKYVDLDNYSYARLLESLGYCSFYKLSGKIMALEYYNKAKDLYLNMYKENVPRYIDDMVSIYYDIGYLMSSMDKSYYAQSEECLKMSLSMVSNQVFFDQVKVATIQDHLGYLLTIFGSERHQEAEEYLQKAIATRKKLYENEPEKYAFDYATSLDNLGYLISHMGESYYSEAYELLTEAMQIRKELNEKSHDKYLSEVSWTVNNLADLMSMMERYGDAKKLYLEAISMRERLNDKNPGVYLSNIAWSYCCLAQCVEDNYDEMIRYYQKALDIYIRLEQSNPSSFKQDILKVEEYIRGDSKPSIKCFLGNQTHINIDENIIKLNNIFKK